MQKFIILILLFVSVTVSAQFSIPKNRDGRDIGAAKELKGQVNVLSIFVNDGNEISQKVKDRYMEELYKAEKWLIKEATIHGIDVIFKNHTIGYDVPISYKPVGCWHDVMPCDVVIKSFGTETKANEWISAHPNCAVIIFSGTEREFCSAVSAVKPVAYGCPYIEGAKIFPYDMNDKSLEIAHEILHLFGAWDLYDGPVSYSPKYDCDYSKWKEHLKQLRFSDKWSIMYDTYGDINNHYIDELTAYMIGWGGELKYWYIQFASN